MAVPCCDGSAGSHVSAHAWRYAGPDPHVGINSLFEIYIGIDINLLIHVGCFVAIVAMLVRMRKKRNATP